MEDQGTTLTPSTGAAPEAAVARKPCPSCGEMIADTAKKCRFCGEVFDASIAPAANAGAGALSPTGGNVNAAEAVKLRLYNPNAASGWSFFFTPFFGAWCCKQNYLTLGLPDKARRSQIWMIVTIIILLLSFVLVCVPYFAQYGGIVNLGWLLFLIVWHFCDCRKQAQYLNENNIAYEKKGWLKPVSVAIGIELLFILVIIFV